MESPTSEIIFNPSKVKSAPGFERNSAGSCRLASRAGRSCEHRHFESRCNFRLTIRWRPSCRLNSCPRRSEGSVKNANGVTPHSVHLRTGCFLASRIRRLQEKLDRDWLLARDISTHTFDSALRSAGGTSSQWKALTGNRDNPLQGFRNSA